MQDVTPIREHLSWGKEGAVITDARFSGVSTGACIGHVGPETLAGGGTWGGCEYDVDAIAAALARRA